MELLQPTASPKKRDTVALLLSERKRSDLVLFLSLFSGMLGLVFLLVVAAVSTGFFLAVQLLVVSIILVLTFRWPVIGFFAVLSCTLLIELNPLLVFGGTPNVFVFYWPLALQGLPDRPIGFFMLFVL